MGDFFALGVHMEIKYFQVRLHHIINLIICIYTEYIFCKIFSRTKRLLQLSSVAALDDSW